MSLETNFVSAEWLWLLLLLPLLALILWWRAKRMSPVVRTPVIPNILKGGFLVRTRPVLFVFRLMALAAIIAALARPQSSDITTKKRGSEGIDIMLSVDISPSMLARDLKPNRLEALKKVAQNFVDNRQGDRIGLVIYAGEAFAQVPLTTDHRVVKNALNELKYDMLDPGTAIGMGLASAVNRLKESESVSKVIILLTDGENNRGIIDPKTAAQLAAQQNIRVYTIAVGTKGFAETPVAMDNQGNFIYRSIAVSIDEDLLKHIAKTTNGRYFRATDNQSLQTIYDEINKLEKSKVEELSFYSYQEHYYPYVLLALAFLALEFLLRITLYRSFI